MIIQPDIAAECAKFNIPPAIIQAVDLAEGDLLKAVRCSVPACVDRAEAIHILCRSYVHAVSDFVAADVDNPGTSLRKQFVDFWAARWAPQGATNDPQHLNQFWAKNVLGFWRQAWIKPKLPLHKESAS